MKRIVSLFILMTILVMTSCGEGYIDSSTTKKLSIEDANKTLDSWLSKVDLLPTPEHEPDLRPSDIPINELPPIDSEFPLSVVGKADVVYEIWGTSEKTGSGIDGALNKIVENYNKSGIKLSNGQTVAWSVRSIDAGASLDYFEQEGLFPNLWTPSNELWGRMADTKGYPIDKLEDKLFGNTAGILMKDSIYTAHTNKYGKVELQDLVTEVLTGNIVLGFTNPFTSGTALNMLCQILTALNPSNPLSDEAVTKFIEFQKFAPAPAYSTSEMRDAAAKGYIDVMVMEYQAYINKPELSDYKFIPFGVVHNSPAYYFGDKLEAYDSLIDFMKQPEQMQIATEAGFNSIVSESYTGAEPFSGLDIYKAQATWKKNKTGGIPTVMIFCTDISGSMRDYGRLNILKESLLNGMQYISENTEVALVTYDEKVTVELPIDKFQGVHRGKFQSIVKSMQDRGSTHINDALLVSFDLVREHQKKDIPSKYVIFLLTDGENKGGTTDKITYQLSASYSDITIIPVGLGVEASMSHLNGIAEVNEGKAYQVTEDNVVYFFKNLFNFIA